MTTALLDPDPVTDDDFDAPDLPGDPDDAAGPVPAGMTRDRDTGELRPKKRPGRPRNPPDLEQLKASEPPPRPADDAPPTPGKKKAVVPDAPMPRAGIISAAVNKMYRRAGKIVRAMDHDIGTAVIECAQDGDPDSVGVAWEALAKSDPKVRAWLLRMIKGGAIWDLVLAHAPIGMAIFMKPRIQAMLTGKRMERLVEAFIEDDGDDPDGLAGMDLDTAERLAERAGMDMEQMMERAQEVAERMADRRMPPGVSPRRAPNGFREQPKNKTRAQRKAAGS
jgi:hypothetical protein